MAPYPCSTATKMRATTASTATATATATAAVSLPLCNSGSVSRDNLFERKWKTRFQQLKEFRQTNGHVNIKFSAHYSLYYWWHKQRTDYNKGTLKLHRQEQLQHLGLLLHARKPKTPVVKSTNKSVPHPATTSTATATATSTAKSNDDHHHIDHIDHNHDVPHQNDDRSFLFHKSNTNEAALNFVSSSLQSKKNHHRRLTPATTTTSTTTTAAAAATTTYDDDDNGVFLHDNKHDFLFCKNNTNQIALKRVLPSLQSNNQKKKQKNQLHQQEQHQHHTRKQHQPKNVSSHAAVVAMKSAPKLAVPKSAPKLAVPKPAPKSAPKSAPKLAPKSAPKLAVKAKTPKAVKAKTHIAVPKPARRRLKIKVPMTTTSSSTPTTSSSTTTTTTTRALDESMTFTPPLLMASSSVSSLRSSSSSTSLPSLSPRQSPTTCIPTLTTVHTSELDHVILGLDHGTMDIPAAISMLKRMRQLY